MATWSCIDKTRYDTQDAAETALANIAEVPKTDRIPTRAYSCRLCLGWHLTSKPKTQRRSADPWRVRR